MPRHNYQIGVPQGGFWQEVLNSDAPLYGGSGQGNFGGVEAVPVPCHGRDYMLTDHRAAAGHGGVQAKSVRRTDQREAVTEGLSRLLFFGV